jgi:hypothetical protein
MGDIPAPISPPQKRDFSAVGQGSYSGMSCTFTITGGINGPPPTPCTGSGTWNVTCNGTPYGNGSWTIP